MAARTRMQRLRQGSFDGTISLEGQVHGEPPVDSFGHDLDRIPCAWPFDSPNTDALILTSATPHNGKSESFAELINLLDPTAIADPTNYSATDIEHLYVRRHKNSPAVEHEVGVDWANRRPLEGVQVPATPQEEAVFNELNDVWLHPPAGQSPAAPRTSARAGSSKKGRLIWMAMKVRTRYHQPTDLM